MIYSFKGINLTAISLVLGSKRMQVFSCVHVNIHKIDMFYNYEMYYCILDFKLKNIGIL